MTALHSIYVAKIAPCTFSVTASRIAQRHGIILLCQTWLVGPTDNGHTTAVLYGVRLTALKQRPPRHALKTPDFG